MKIRLLSFVLIMFCWSGPLWAQTSDEVQDKINLINTLTQDGVSFRYLKDATLSFHSEETNAMTDSERALLPYLPETLTARVASFGVKLENITIELTHTENRFLLENSSEERFGEFSADSIGFTIKKNIVGWVPKKNLSLSLNFFAGIDRTESYFKIAPTDETSQELEFSNYGGTLGFEAGFELIGGIFINMFIMTNKQIYERGYYKGYDGYGAGIEIFSTGKSKE